VEPFSKELQVCSFGLKEHGHLFVLVLQFAPQKELTSFMRHHILALGTQQQIKSGLYHLVFQKHPQQGA
jgi:hypothetical protein